MSDDQYPVIDRSAIRCGSCFFRDLEKVNNMRPSKINPQELVAEEQYVHFCKRNPPAIPTPYSNVPYPVVNPERDWCGEFSNFRNYAKEANDGQEAPSQEGQEESEQVASEV